MRGDMTYKRGIKRAESKALHIHKQRTYLDGWGIYEVNLIDHYDKLNQAYEILHAKSQKTFGHPGDKISPYLECPINSILY